MIDAEKLIKRYGKARPKRDNFKSLYEKVYSYVLPDRYTQIEDRVEGQNNRIDLYSSVAEQAADHFVQRVQSLLTPVNQDWIGFEAGYAYTAGGKDPVEVNRALEQIKCKRVLKPDKDIIKRSITELSDKDFDELLQCGYVMENYQKLDKKDNKGFESLYFMDVKMTESQLEKAVEHIMNDSGCGDVFRVKGFMQNEDGKWLQLNATHNGIDLKPIEKGQDVLIVIGENLKEENVKKYIRNM